MKVHKLERAEFLPISKQEAWEFFSRPENLNELTPPDMEFRIEFLPDGKMYEGEIICYKIRLAPMIWTRWVTEIKSVKEGENFIDEQRAGPYQFWHHMHRFEEVEGGTKVTDLVHYAIGWGIFGEIAHALFVRKKLQHVFDFRRQKMQELFGK